MKKILLALFALVFGALPALSSVTVDIDAGNFTDPNETPVANSLLVLVDIGTATNATVPQTTAGSFSAGGDLVLAFATLNTNGSGNTTNNPITFNLSPAASGDKLALEWFPEITNPSVGSPTAPSAGQDYAVINPNGGDASGPNPWEVPSDGNTFFLDYITTSAGGTFADSTAESTNFVAAAAPEPATYALMLFALPLFAWGYRHQVMVMAAAAQGRRRLLAGK
jgi:hypothetical protein